MLADENENVVDAKTTPLLLSNCPVIVVPSYSAATM
jgi:hypothetical protein